MKFLIITGSPKKDGLCFSVMKEIERGAADGGVEVSIINANGIEKCKCCEEGWGECLKNNCTFGEKDGFNEARDAFINADAICLITPVYWGETAEGLKAFIDRMRRCEFTNKQLEQKQIMLVAVPGGSGNGALPCLEQMDRFCRHVGVMPFDYIGINRWNSDYKKAAAYSAAKVMAEGRKVNDTV